MDDLYLYGPDISNLNWAKEQMSQCYKLKDVEFGMEDYHPVKTLMEDSVDFAHNDEEPVLYMNKFTLWNYQS
ncbi:hypothetical protein FQN50_007652, partial [Emmonsiellopsis sp. PD_5]